MTINLDDIKLLESERMSDTSDGGGRRTSRVIVDGAPGNIFPKVSRLDSTYGRVNMRKVYFGVLTDNLDTYAGAVAILTVPPENAKIHAVLFSTGSDFDQRAAARDRVESYVVAGPESRMTLFGRQLVGQQALLVFQRPEEALPEVGEVFCLSKEAGGIVAAQQFVRLTDMTSEIRTFSDSQGDYQRRVVSLQISAPLRSLFEGPESPPRASSVTKPALVRSTTVANASRYFGIQKLVEAVSQNALQVTVASVYTPIVPTTERESPVSMASIGGAGGYVVTSHEEFNTYRSFTNTHYFPTGVKPGTIRILNPSGVLLAEDDGFGAMIPTGASGSAPFNGTVDYGTGRVSTNATSTSYFQAKPAVEVSDPARTKEIKITLGNRGTVFLDTLQPPPNPGSVIIDYRALGKWYRLRDNGDGQISGGDRAYGIGTVDYVTGAMVVTLGALPDVDSSLLTSWGTPTDYVIRAGDTGDVADRLEQEFTLTHLPIQPGSFSMTFVHSISSSATATKTATANSSGVISGNGVTGVVNHTTGRVRIKYTTFIPDFSTQITASYNQQVPADPGNPINISGTFTPLAPPTLSPAPIVAGSFSAMVLVNAPGMGNGAATISDNGVGLLIMRGGQHIGAVSGAPVSIAADQAVGTINYSTGATAMSTLTVNVTMRRYAMTVGDTSWTPTTEEATIVGNGGYVYTQNGGDPVQTAKVDVFDLEDAPLLIDLTATSGEPIVPGSVCIRLGQQISDADTATYFDRNGSMCSNLNAGTGAAGVYGNINYYTGVAALTGGWYRGSSSNIVRAVSCLTKRGDFSTVEAFFRTAGSPLRPGSFYVQATAEDGELLSGTSNADGDVIGTGLTGEAVHEMGVARIEFSKPIAPSTLRYSAVVRSNLPLNADQLGLDPVRLPSDGRVPIFKPADVVVIHHTDDETLPNPAEAGETYSVGRANLAQLVLLDADDKKVPSTKFTGNLGAGTLTMAADLDLTGFAQPLKARHRIEEMQLLSDVLINGQLSLTSPLSRDYPADSYVSSALLFGDMSARVTNFFDQAAWTNVWSDALIGSGATAQFNDIDYPVEVLNETAMTERWRLNFTGTSTFQVIGENLGVIATGTTGADCAPVNPLTEEPYFVLRAAGWGGGWAAGNQVRFNTIGATAPVWIARTVLPGATLEGDSLHLQMRGDTDA